MITYNVQRVKETVEVVVWLVYVFISKNIHIAAKKGNDVW